MLFVSRRVRDGLPRDSYLKGRSGRLTRRSALAGAPGPWRQFLYSVRPTHVNRPLLAIRDLWTLVASTAAPGEPVRTYTASTPTGISASSPRGPRK